MLFKIFFRTKTPISTLSVISLHFLVKYLIPPPAPPPARDILFTAETQRRRETCTPASGGHSPPLEGVWGRILEFVSHLVLIGFRLCQLKVKNVATWYNFHIQGTCPACNPALFLFVMIVPTPARETASLPRNLCVPTARFHPFLWCDVCKNSNLFPPYETHPSTFQIENALPTHQTYTHLSMQYK